MPRSPARTFFRLLTALVATLTLGVLLAAPATSAAEPGARSLAQKTVAIQNFTFTPQSVTVNAGDSVRWVNNDEDTHTTTSDGPGWDSGDLPPGAAFTRTFTTRGTFVYHCTLHPSMTGTVIVQ
ncbi:cupredoxin domain-containing protein [Streptomyces sp. ISL-11]|uniref:cupredoxin domain-containing protein n=1 Tax=Streptomyces sp. ISL-11 TaxID=2819174 RepID=UPI001BE5AA50|nr:cupredoxin domain-containing protein [Streptomyces sp. ISL-11]MBT2382132.1 cupredoxin domain-containing protein [Streptomyces sp. ISL-11]